MFFEGWLSAYISLVITEYYVTFDRSKQPKGTIQDFRWMNMMGGEMYVSHTE